MKSELEGWQPLRHPHLCHAAMEEWKTLLQDPYKSSSNKSSARGTGTQSSVQMDPYDRLVWDVLMPHVRAMTLYVPVSQKFNLLLEKCINVGESKCFVFCSCIFSYFSVRVGK